ncbi:MAG: hypothetical protein HOD58_06290 [Gammaproteobacteria bacterium]|nr:hypothetical protein [Alphaproteobacteria bacterium]MBT4329518.1 hypothetical protein [Gammaproteobacteria bacterium]
MIHCAHLRKQIIRPTLKFLDKWSPAAENLLLGTAAQESQMGTYLRQIGGGPACGMFQIEPKTNRDVWNKYLKYRPDIAEKVSSFMYSGFDQDFMLVSSLPYATSIARLVYWRSPLPLPNANDVEGLAEMWKEVYNTKNGAGTEQEFVENYHRYVVD